MYICRVLKQQQKTKNMKKQIFTFETISAVFFGAVIIFGFIAVLVKTLF